MWKYSYKNIKLDWKINIRQPVLKITASSPAQESGGYCAGGGAGNSQE